MILLEAVRIALSQLWAHRLRSILTLLGMLIGVGSVVGIVSISEGLRRTVIDEFSKIGGDNLIIIQPQPFVMRDGRWVRASHYEPLTLKDIEYVQAASERFATVLPLLSAGVEVRHQKATYSGQLIATMPSYTRAFNWAVEQGRFLRDKDLEKRRTVCVLGTEITEKLFEESSPLGRQVKLKGRRYTVVGVMEERKMFDQDWGNQILVPVTTAQKRMFGNKNINALIALTRESADVPVVIPAIQRALKKYHGKKAEYRIESGKGILEQVEQTILVMKLVTGGIAGISLLVGGIGIMNIMLVSVTERVREIGIRKALGAKPATLLLQFIVEAVSLSLAGGIMGVGMGIGLGMGISQVIEHFAERPFPSVVAPGSVLLALGLSVTIGLFFGIYPAARASRLDPVEALRSE